MKGRLENEIKLRNSINVLLESMPSYCTGFYRTLENLERQTCNKYIYDIRKFLAWADRDIKEIDEVCLGEYFEYISTKVNKNGMLCATSASYRKTTYASLNRFFKYLYQKKIIDSNPMDFIQRTNKKDEIKRFSLTIGDLNKVLECAKRTSNPYMWKFNRRNYLAMYLLMYTGMREGALIQINVSDIDFENKTLTVIDKRDKTLVYDLDDKIIGIINNWLEYRGQLLEDSGKMTDALFIGPTMERLSSTGIRQITNSITERALGYKVSPHKFRSTFITLYYEESGHDIEATRIAVGHESITTTSRYIAKDNSYRRAAGSFMSENLI